ncbi:HipA domain-containing protein [Actomonas aquatica]|uniref:HipA domain-containing protein n=1 Tax=Actomonas aquatica TaxID=2866162 RepID=A0ABZ1C5B6_9BACT|nr:HipA domain-containing protein [Opitutus sp. WL0086]WRQ86921.1 HipA domain-containing protein [Opitutus sp. WL0086]
MGEPDGVAWWLALGLASTGLKPEWADAVHDRYGYCEGLPFFLTDLRPQGYLGRAAIHQLPEGTSFPSDIRLWSDDHVISYLVRFGEDLPGNLVLGDETSSMAMFGASGLGIRYSERETAYPRMADAAVAGNFFGSSVEGEQPKFTTWLRDDADREAEAVIVKFTDRLSTPTGRRWADLLAAEQAARLVVSETALADAEFPYSELFDFGDRRFYQIARFDRIGRSGRRGLVSLRALHDAGLTGGETNDWVEAVEGLARRGWVSPADLRVVRLRAAFGNLIGNTDMHFGNLAFYLEDRLPLRLAPLFDMVPMLWAPRPGESEPLPEFRPKLPTPRHLDVWSEAAELAERFWERITREAFVSVRRLSVTPAFRAVAANALRTIRDMKRRLT